jgi:hypothetical protein
MRKLLRCHCARHPCVPVVVSAYARCALGTLPSLCACCSSRLPVMYLATRRSIDTALNFLVKQIYATWQQNDDVATLLSLDMTGAFDGVIPARMLHNMRERKVPDWIVKWVGSSISNRTMTLCLRGYNTDAFPTHMGIPQGSLLSLILFLFDNDNLVNACNPPTSPCSGIGFVDDMNALAFGKTTEDNCRTLQSIHKHCLEWARKQEVYPCALHQSKEKEQHCLPSHPPIIHTHSQPICSCLGGHPQQKTQLAAPPAAHQIQACHLDQCS